jgi:hypothetical protein
MCIADFGLFRRHGLSYYAAEQSLKIRIRGKSEDVGVYVHATDATASESPLSSGSFPFERVGDKSLQLTVLYTTSGTADCQDYQCPPLERITIPSGVPSAKRYINPINDAIPEKTETGVLTLKNHAAYTVLSPDSATVSIYSDDIGVYIEASDPYADLFIGDDTAKFKVSRVGQQTLPLTVYYQVSGSAIEGLDFFLIPKKVTIPAGSSHEYITIKAIPDPKDIRDNWSDIYVTLADGPYAKYQLIWNIEAHVQIRRHGP